MYLLLQSARENDCRLSLIADNSTLRDDLYVPLGMQMDEPDNPQCLRMVSGRPDETFE